MIIFEGGVVDESCCLLTEIEEYVGYENTLLNKVVFGFKDLM